MSSREHVLAALDGVIDPELDEPITSLRFVSSVDITSDGDVEVLLRAADTAVRPELRILDGSRRTRGRVAAPGGANGHYQAPGPLHRR
jgi:Iron-sulfur cluster assembly protein